MHLGFDWPRDEMLYTRTIEQSASLKTNGMSSKPWIKLSLILPLIMNAGFAYLCLKGASFADVLDKDHERLSDELGTRLSF